jgi:hypothetical protein
MYVAIKGRSGPRGREAFPRPSSSQHQSFVAEVEVALPSRAAGLVKNIDQSLGIDVSHRHS